MIRLYLLSLLLHGVVANDYAQAQPVKWQFSALPVNSSEATVYFTATLEEGWHLYSQFIEEGGPLPTTFTFAPGNNYTVIGNVKEESLPVKSYDETFMMDIAWYTGTAVFSQHVKLASPRATIQGTITFMACKDDLCLPPEDVPFSISCNGTNKEEDTF